MPERSLRSTEPTSKKPFSVEAGGQLLQETAVSFVVYALAALAVRLAPDAGRVPLEAGTGFVWYFFASFAAATALLVLLLRANKSTRFFAILFALAVFGGVFTLTDAIFGTADSILLTSAAVLLYYAVPRVIVFDAVLVFGLAGIAANLGSGFRPAGLVIILAALAVYDIIAVYWTKHMVAMAEALVQRKVFFAILIPERLQGYLTRVSDVARGKGFTFLGTGDVALPALLVASAARVGLAEAVSVSIGALAGLAATHLLFNAQSPRRPMPALPPIALGAILGYLFTFLFP